MKTTYLKKIKLGLILLACSPMVLAQHSSYSGLERREIKALSPEQVQQYLSGAGMGHAMPAELNRFPGPMHVLELAHKLSLTPEQRARTEALMGEHKAEARAIGARRIEAEQAIESMFRSGTVEEQALQKLVATSAVLEGQYRLAHLETHRRMRALLTEEQVSRYVALRGYDGGSKPHGRGH
jgi:Spy/CpxP family protein refolding chaperone